MSDFARLQELARNAGLAVNPPSVVDIPYASGTGAVGATLNCTMGNWTNEPDEYLYRWMRDGTPVDQAGAAADYTVVAGDAGHSLSCVVTATNEAGSTTASPSNAIDVPAAARRTGHRDVPTPVHDAHADARRAAASSDDKRK